MKISKTYEIFAKEAPDHYSVWIETVQKLEKASKLDKKNKELAYLSVLATARLEGGIPFHVKMAKANGATRDEVISYILIGLPAVGNIVTQSLPAALEAYDE